MKFLVDAQLPRSLAIFLCSKGHDAIHTLDLPDGNDTTDGDINRISIAEGRVVISKDGDFYDSFTRHRALQTPAYPNRKFIQRSFEQLN